MHVIGISGLDRTLDFKQANFPDLAQRGYRIAQGFDSAAALVSHGEIVAAAAEERFCREKGTHRFPKEALRYCLVEGGISPEDVGLVAHSFSYDQVEVYFSRGDLTQRRYREVLAPEVQRRALQEAFPSVDWTERFVPVPHHLAHAASAYYPSGYDEALVLITDGMGEIHSATALVATPDGMEIIAEIPASHSLGILYGAITLYLGFWMGFDEYKVMGLAPYGDPSRYLNELARYVELVDDGTYRVPLLALNRSEAEKETHGGVLRELQQAFGPPREPGTPIEQRHKDLAAALQALLERAQLHLLRHLKVETGLENLCMAGGVALNCTANGVIRKSGLFRRMFVQPAAGDDGSSLGAALWVAAERGEDLKTLRTPMSSPYWGPGFGAEDIRRAIDGRDEIQVADYGDDRGLLREVARRIGAGEVIGWYQGRMEFGPRALGSRSILADARDPGMRDKVNGLVKKREGFRPFAPAVRAEAASRYFEIEPGDEETFAHMLYVVPVREEFRDQLPAITHVNGSARPQVVLRDHNPLFWDLLVEVEAVTGVPVVLNTSFNVRGQPIVCTPEEAVDTFLMANLDALAIGTFLLQRDAAAVGSSPLEGSEAPDRGGSLHGHLGG